MHCPILLRITVLNNEQHNQNKPKNATRNFRNLSKHNTCKKREIKPKKEKLKVDFPKKKIRTRLSSKTQIWKTKYG